MSIITRQNAALEWQEHHEYHHCDIPVCNVFRRTLRAIWTSLAAYQRARSMMRKSNHGSSDCIASDGSCRMTVASSLHHLFFSTWSQTLACPNTSSSRKAFIAQHAVNDSERPNVAFGMTRTSRVAPKDKTVHLEWREHHEYHHCDWPVWNVFSRISRAVWTSLAAYQRHVQTRVQVARRS